MSEIASSNTTIIIVDDDPNLRKTLSDILRAKGYATTDAADGKTALAAIMSKKPVVALIDLRLPDMGGLELIRAVRECSPGTECIVLTGHASQDSAIEAVNVGAYSYVQKPYDMGQLLLTIRRAIERRQVDDALAFERSLLRSLLDQTPDLIWFIDQEVRYVATSKSHARYLGVDPEDMIGKTNLSFYPEETARKWIGHEKRIMKTKQPMIGKEEKIKSPVTGEEMWVSTTKIPRYDENGNVIGTLGLSRNITERKEAEQALKAYSEQLEEMVAARTRQLQEALQKAQLADKLKTEFITNINHELRTPLTNLVLYHQLLRSHPSMMTKERLDVMGREIRRLRILIEDLLNLSRMDLGQVAFHPKLHNLNQLIQTLVNDRRALAEGRELALITELSPVLPLVWLDEALVVQAVSNLLTNALNYTPKGGSVCIRSGVLKDQSDRQWVVFSVQDSGPGINKDDLPHLFERFYRGKAGHKTGVPGTGLGLAIAKEVVEKHHGKIETENIEGDHGAIFTVWLPVKPEQELEELMDNHIWTFANASTLLPLLLRLPNNPNVDCIIDLGGQVRRTFPTHFYVITQRSVAQGNV